MLRAERPLGQEFGEYEDEGRAESELDQVMKLERREVMLCLEVRSSDDREGRSNGG